MIDILRRQVGKWTGSRPSYPGMADGRVYVVGDIHGRSDLLDRVHHAIDAETDQAGDATEIYLGDYVDRGRDSFGVIERLLARRAEHDLVCLRGNHEEMFENFLYGRLAIEEWRAAGGMETLMSYGISPGPIAHAPSHAWVEAAHRRVPASHHRFLTDLVTSYRSGPYFFAHAGIRPGVPLESQDPNDLLWIRDGFLGDRSDFGAIVVHGHTPTRRVDFRTNRINIDTGAYITDRLTCLCIDATGPRIIEH